MNVMTGAERTRLHRERKAKMEAAREFSSDYLSSAHNVTFDEFVEAKLEEAFPAVQFDQTWLKAFSTALSEYDEEDSGKYAVSDLMTAWSDAEESLEEAFEEVYDEVFEEVFEKIFEEMVEAMDDPSEDEIEDARTEAIEEARIEAIDEARMQTR